jgi:hypothetical protein
LVLASFLVVSFSLEAKIVSVLDLKNNKLANVLIFISKDCPCSKANLSYINKLAEEFTDYHFIAIHAKKNVTNSEVETYLRDKKLGFDIVNDSDLSIANTYKALKTPHAFILHGNDVVYNGGITNSTMPEHAKEFFLRDALVSMKKNGKPDRPETKTLGCFISR